MKGREFPKLKNSEMITAQMVSSLSLQFTISFRTDGVDHSVYKEVFRSGFGTFRKHLQTWN